MDDDQDRKDPARLRAAETWIFDLDNTLYPASTNLFGQVDVRIGKFIADLLDLDPVAARTLQKRYFREYGTSLRGLMECHGVDPEAYMSFVHDIDVTAVAPSPALDEALTRLDGRKIIFTNGSVAHAERVTDRLGVARHFEAIFDIAAADYVPKPQPAVYDQLVDRHEIEPRRAVMVEDIARNLVPAAAMGMVTVWVRNGSRWGADGAEGDHVHHVIDDLADWLVELVASG